MNPPKSKKRRIVVGVSQENWETTRILESGSFDTDYYCSNLGIQLSESEAVQHYIREGEKLGLNPSAHFNANFYAQINSDVVEQGVNLFAHFLVRGKGEGRYANQDVLKSHAEEISQILFDKPLVTVLRGRKDAFGLTEIEAHLAYGWRDGNRLIERFDDLVYFALYNYDRDLEIAPLVHYVRFGTDLNYFVSDADIKVHRQAIKPEFDEDYYTSQGRVNEDVSALDEFCSVGWRLGRNPNRHFDTKFYMAMYRDITALQISPFYHFVTSGKKEGRVPKPSFESILTVGNRKFDAALKTIVVASHEASRTGAPLLGLDIGRQLMSRFNVIYILMKGGELVGDFLDTGTFVVKDNIGIVQLTYLLNFLDENFDVPLIIANSVETVEVVEAALPLKIPVVGLVHEFAEYTLPPGKISRMVLAADLVVTPAELISASVQMDVKRVAQFTSNNIRVRQQGKLEGLAAVAGKSVALSIEDIRDIVRAPADGNVKIVLGAGHVQVRKGVDTFVQTAHEVIKRFGDDVRFVWVGGGYMPETDVTTSVWIRAMIERLGLSKHVYFIPAQPTLDNLYDLADVFYLSSRLDPFPNVAIDALTAGKRIVCFNDGTGVAEWMADGRLDGAAVEYGNVTEAAAEIHRLLGLASFSEKNFEAGKKYFAIGDYVDDLLAFGNEAAEIRARIIADEETIRAGRLFDEVFFSADPAGVIRRDELIRKYCVWSQKGAVIWNPRPGFNEGAYRTRHGLVGQPVSMLSHASENGSSLPTTHVCHDLENMEVAQSSSRVAIHLHLHYTDLAPEFATRFGEFAPKADLFITVTSELARREVEYAFRHHKSDVTVMVVKNRGRDIAPMLAVLHKHHADYEIFGHFHGKKSLFAGGTLGDDWRAFLMGTLFGTAESTEKLWALFERDPELGLVFAEDRMNTGWTKNLDLGVAMAQELGLNTELDAYPIFPIGTMFWARTKALAPLIASSLSASDFPPEPLPDDETSLHAIERLMPTIVQAAGYSWCTVRRKEINRRA